MNDDARHVAPTASRFVRGAEIAVEPITAIEGAAGKGRIAVKPLLAGRDMLFIEIHREKGLVDAEHAHDDHESICNLLEGRMRVVIEGEEFIAEPGDAWIHPPGVRHYNETLEDSVQIEIKAPPRKTWS